MELAFEQGNDVSKRASGGLPWQWWHRAGSEEPKGKDSAGDESELR